MSIFTYGQTHRWFAWHPVDTDDQGWKWMRWVWRCRQYANPAFGPAMRFWFYQAELSCGNE